MLLTIVNTRPSPPLAILIATLTLLPLYFASYQYRRTHPYSGNDNSAAEQALRTTSAEDAFIAEYLQYDLLPTSSFNPSALARYCNQTTIWHTDVVLRLANANGGIGNVRGNILDFVFTAIELGASIVLPGFARRSKDNIGDVWGGGPVQAPFGEWFDEEWFLSALQRGCPEMVVYRPQEGQEMVKSANGEKGNYLPKSRRMDVDFPNNDKKSAVVAFEEWLKGAREGKAMQAEAGVEEEEEITLVDLERTLWDVDTRSLPEGFRRNFGMLLKFQSDVRRLAAVAVHELSEKFELGIRPKVVLPKPGRGFYGAHLRTEQDAVAAGWVIGNGGANFTTQTDAYIQHALAHGLNVMYVASGNATELHSFAVKALAHRPSLAVVSKFDLLPATDAQILQEMTWDQQALVDYEILQRCSVFGGFVKSSFSYNIAMTRNQWLEDQACVMVDPWMVQHSEEGVSFDDGISRLVGRDSWHEKRIPRGMWP